MARKLPLCVLGLALVAQAIWLVACGAGVGADQIGFHGQASKIGEGGAVELTAMASISSYVYVPIGSLQSAAPIATAHSSLGGVYSLTTDAIHTDQRIVFSDDLSGASVEVIFTGLTPGAGITVSPILPAGGSVQGATVDASHSGEYDTAGAYVYVPPPALLRTRNGNETDGAT